MTKPQRQVVFEAVATSDLECPTCGALDLNVRAEAPNPPVCCWRCGDYLGRLSELRGKTITLATRNRVTPPSR